MIYEWDEPTPTKSGRCVVEIWNELKIAHRSYKMYRYLLGDKSKITSRINMVIKAKEIRKLQADMGIRQDKFPELGIFNET